MGRIRRTVAMGGVVIVVSACLLGGVVGAQVPPAPVLPVPDLPAELDPIIAVTAPTLGPTCGTASLLALLAPSIAEGYLKIPVSLLIDSDAFRSYANAALYLCGFIPFPLTPTQCQLDTQIVDAIRGLSPLAAQVVGLFPEGATVDTVLAIEGLLPSGPSVAGPLADELAVLMSCKRSSGAPATPSSPSSVPPPPAGPSPTAELPDAVVRPPTGSPLATVGPAAPSVTAAPARPETRSGVVPAVFETRLVPRSGVQWAGVLIGALLLAGSLAGWWSTRRGGRDQSTSA
jgi:hypothetical protein